MTKTNKPKKEKEEGGGGGGEECLSCIELSTNYCVHLKKMIFCGSFATSISNVKKNLITLKTYTINETCRCGQKVWGWTLYVFKLNLLSLRSWLYGSEKMNAWKLFTSSRAEANHMSQLYYYLFLCIK